MNVIQKLASSLNRRDEVPNQELAKQIAGKNDKKAVKELIDNLANKSRDIQNDCIKVLYEIGERKPALLSPYSKIFVELLDNKNNRLQWGAMTALNTIAPDRPEAIYRALPKIIESANNGSVITKDYCVNILLVFVRSKNIPAKPSHCLSNNYSIALPINCRCMQKNRYRSLMKKIKRCL
ncbi:MAG: hypothetical protein ABI691_08905 [Ginsengibacter sp.]